MTWFSLFISLLLFHVAAFTTGADVDVREMSIDEYINFVNPPAVHKYVNECGQTILCVKFTDHISVKYSPVPAIRALAELSEPEPWIKALAEPSDPEPWIKALSHSRGRSISTVRPDSGGPSISTVRSDSGGPSISTVRPDSGGPSLTTVRPDSGGPSVLTVRPDTGGPSALMVPQVKFQCPEIVPPVKFERPEMARTVKFECPEGTVPVIEIKREEVERFGSVRQFVNRAGHGRRPSRRNVDPQDGMENQHSVARFDSLDEPISKIAARLNLWSPKVAPDAEISLSKIWINNENEGKLETIEASLFDALSHGANQFHGGGEVSHNSKTPRPMTVTDIGSGHFPGKGVTFAMGHTNVLSWWG